MRQDSINGTCKTEERAYAFESNRHLKRYVSTKVNQH